MSENIASLREKIAECAESGRSINRMIRESRGPERQRLRLEKRAVGREARVALLSYAMSRGVPYRRLESRCLEDRSPYLRDVLARRLARTLEGADEAVRSWLGAPGEAA